MQNNIVRSICVAGATFLLAATVGCSSGSNENTPGAQAQIFDDEKTDNYSMSFSSDFPTDGSEATATASDASGKGPFVVTVACSSGGSMTLGIDDEQERDIECNGNKVKIEGVQKIAKAGGVKFWASSDKDDGSWKIQLVGSKK